MALLARQEIIEHQWLRASRWVGVLTVGEEQRPRDNNRGEREALWRIGRDPGEVAPLQAGSERARV